MKIELIKKTDKKKFSVEIVPVFGKKYLKILITKYKGMGDFIKNFDFSGEQEESLVLNFPESGGKTVILAGAGNSSDLDSIRKLSKSIIKITSEMKVEKVLISFLPEISLSVSILGNFIDFLYINSYSFNKYKKGDKKNRKIKSMSLYIPDNKIDKDIFNERYFINEGVRYARDLINDTPSEVNPGYLIDQAKKISNSPSVSMNITEGKELEKERLTGLLSVGKGSVNKPGLIKLSYIPNKYSIEISLVGKGITYDSGGLNLKPGSSMLSMKSDMSGAAILLGIFKILCELNISIKLNAFIPVAENMPAGSSYKPDDIITFRNGKSVEIINTDAEGRLILADAIIMASEDKPDHIIEFSTLTGSIVTALGDSFAGLMSRDRKIKKNLLKAGEITGEYLWEMPLYDNYKNSIKSKISDLKNADYGGASSIKAGLFLDEFADNVSFAHIDIAGTAFLDKPNEYYSNSGATGYGIRLIWHYLKSFNL
ncbi:MAG: leucyl aminopeptidase [Acidobacteriota bacterium]